jgi:hypothetical protein
MFKDMIRKDLTPSKEIKAFVEAYKAKGYKFASNIAIYGDAKKNFVYSVSDEAALAMHIEDVKKGMIKGNNILIIDKTGEKPATTMYLCHYTKEFREDIEKNGCDVLRFIDYVTDKSKDLTQAIEAGNTIVFNKLTSPRIFEGKVAKDQSKYFSIVVTVDIVK